MRILALSDSKELDAQMGLASDGIMFPGVKIDFSCDMSPLRMERALIAKHYDGVFLSAAVSNQPVWRSAGATLWDVLSYQEQNHIGSRVADLMLLRDKALSDWRSGLGLPGRVIPRSMWEQKRDKMLKRINSLTFPIVLEGNLACAPVDRIAVYSEDETAQSVDLLFSQNPGLTELLARKYPSYYKRYTVLVLGNGDSLVCWPTATIPQVGKEWTSSAVYHVGAISDPQLAERLTQCARKLAHIFSSRDYCKFDFLVDLAQRIYFSGVDAAPSLAKIRACACANALPLHTEQVFALLLLIFSRRTGLRPPDSLLGLFSKSLFAQLGI